MDEHRIQDINLHLDEQEAALLARAVQILIRELGFPSEDVERSFKDSFVYFMKTA